MPKLQLARTAHLYLGLVFAPSIIFFAFTGAVQLFGWHESHEGNSYQTPDWLAVMAQVHIHQRSTLPKAKPFKAPLLPAADSTKPVQANLPDPETKPQSPFMLKCYFLLLAFGLIVTTVLGVYMSFAYLRSRRLIFGLLTLGVIVPVALLCL